MLIPKAFLLFSWIASAPAFAPPHPFVPRATNDNISPISYFTFQLQPLSSSSSNNDSSSNSSTVTSSTQPHFTHADIEWRLGPSEDTPPLEKLKLKAAANAIRTELMIKGEVLPPILCPKGGKALLEAYMNGKQVGRFGITTARGPPAPLLDETVIEFYNLPPTLTGVGAAAIIYMYVEPSHRSRGIGELALEVIAAIQTIQGSDFTVLVADDDGSGKLVNWYEGCGFRVAPKLQGLFGSTDGEYGVAMIRPTSVRADIFKDCTIRWW